MLKVKKQQRRNDKNCYLRKTYVKTSARMLATHLVSSRHAALC